jgi:signal transduction histidine kinase
MTRWRDGPAWTGGPPPWWPAGEPWPPRGRRYLRDRRRARFVRRSGWYSFLPVWVVLWLIASATRWGHGAWPAVLVACGIAAGGIALFVRRVATPLGEIVAASDRISRGDFAVRVETPVHGPAWIGDTARAFNAMAGQLEVQDTGRRQLMADVAHELRTPLAVLQGTLEGVIDGVYPGDDERLQGLLDQTRVLARLVDDLGTLATAEGGALGLSREPVDLAALARDVVASFTPRAEAGGVALRLDAAPVESADPISADPVRIREVLTNLVANALRATPMGGAVTIGITASGAAIEISVSDTGGGIAAEDLPHVFDRFYKGAGSAGSGLGLTIARTLVESHGGTIRAASTPGAGTTMTFTLPR